MRLRIVPARQGLTWVRNGLDIARRQPFHMMGLVGMVASSAILLAGLPVLGALVVVAAMPLIWMGFMLATRRVLAGERLTPGVLVESVRGPDSPRQALAQLGGAYVLATLAVMQLAHWFGPGADVLGEVIEKAKDVSEVVSHPDVQRDMLWRMGLTLPVSLVFWHTPALVVWGRVPVGKALFFSAVASWRNLGAFVVYGLGWLLAVTALVAIDQMLLSLLPGVLGSLLAVMSGLWLFSAFYASLYFTVADCFESGSPADPALTPTDA